MVKNKKDLRELITYTVVLIFAFIYIKPIINILLYIIELFSPIIIGFIMAFVINVLMNTIENKWFKKELSNVKEKNKRIFSLTLSLIIIIGVVFIVGLLIIPELKNTIEIFMGNISSYQDNLNNFLSKFGISLEEGNVINQFVENISSYIRSNGDSILNLTLGIASNVVSTVVEMFIGLVFAIYLLAGKEKFCEATNNLIDAYLPKRFHGQIDRISKLSNKIFASFVSGQCLEALIIGLLCFGGMLLLRLPYAPTIAVLVGFTALIPVFGAFIGTIVGAFLIFMINPMQAIIFIIFIIVLQQFETNLIYPRVVGKSVNLPAILVLVAVTIGANLGGVWGMLLSVPCASILYSIIVTDVNTRINKQKDKIVKL